MMWFIFGLTVGLFLGVGLDVGRWLGESHAETDLQLLRSAREKIEFLEREVRTLEQKLEEQTGRLLSLDEVAMFHERMRLRQTQDTYSPELQEAFEKAKAEALAEAVLRGEVSPDTIEETKEETS